MNWYIEVIRKYAIFSGRARRQEFWMFTLFSFIISVLLSIVDNVLDLKINNNNSGILNSIYSLFVFMPSLSVSVRRLHDIGKSGTYLLLLIFAPIAIAFMWIFMFASIISASISIIFLIIFILLYFTWYIYIFAKDSVFGPNEYGNNPKGLGNNEEIDIEEHLSE